MKIAYYVEDGREQLVLTPETELEKKMLSLLDGDKDIKIYKGSFYGCQGGWTRQTTRYPSLHGVGTEDDTSRIIVLDAKKKADV
jgi:hypothetical protein